jgi:hypothetical protein
MILSLAGSLWIAGCDEGHPEVAPESPEMRSDREALREIVATDAAAGPLEEVENMISVGRPVLAAELLHNGAIPAAHRQVERVVAFEPTTDIGASLKREALDVYGGRVEALGAYQRALERGQVDDLILLDAIGGVRRATTALLELDRKLEAENGEPEPRRNEEQRTDRIGGKRP